MLGEVLAPLRHRRINEWGKIAAPTSAEVLVPKLLRDRSAGTAHSCHHAVYRSLQLIVAEWTVVRLGLFQNREHLIGLSPLRGQFFGRPVTENLVHAAPPLLF